MKIETVTVTPGDFVDAHGFFDSREIVIATMTLRTDTFVSQRLSAETNRIGKMTRAGAVTRELVFSCGDADVKVHR